MTYLESKVYLRSFEVLLDQEQEAAEAPIEGVHAQHGHLDIIEL